MPKNKFQDVVFTFLMASVMVYGMVVYNLTLNTGTVTEAVFVSAFRELPVMIPAAFVLEFFIVGKIAKKLAFKVMRPDDRPQFITYAVSICICCIMCPVMSLIATILFKQAGSEIISVWLQTTFMNFPVAFFWQLCYCGPFVRFLFGKMFPDNKN